MNKPPEFRRDLYNLPALKISARRNYPPEPITLQPRSKESQPFYIPFTELTLFHDSYNHPTSGVPNERLKLTELAVDDFAARRWTDLAPMIGTAAQQTTVRRLVAAAA